MKSSGSTSCGACKFLRRKCTNECVFAPHFCYDEAANHFAKVHRVFGASNVSKLLLHLPVHKRSDAATTIAYEAIARMHDPIYGCVSHIFALQQQVACLQQEIYTLSNHMADQAFQEHNSGSFEATSDPIVGLEFISQPSYNNMDERPSQMLFDEGAISDTQELCSQLDDKVPNLYGCEEQLYNVPSYIDLSESLLGGTSQELFVPYIWMSSSCNNLQ